MIRSVMVMNTQGKPRLAKFYDFQVSLSQFLPSPFPIWEDRQVIIPL